MIYKIASYPLFNPLIFNYLVSIVTDQIALCVLSRIVYIFDSHALGKGGIWTVVSRHYEAMTRYNARAVKDGNPKDVTISQDHWQQIFSINPAHFINKGGATGPVKDMTDPQHPGLNNPSFSIDSRKVSALRAPSRQLMSFMFTLV